VNLRCKYSVQGAAAEADAAETSRRRGYSASTVTSLFVPITLCMLLVVVTVNTVTFFRDTSTSVYLCVSIVVVVIVVVILLNRYHASVNPLIESKVIIVPHRIIRSWYRLMGGLLHLVQRGRDWAGRQPA